MDKSIQNEREIEIIHYVNGNQLNTALGENNEEIVFGMGCFWGPERIFWQTSGVFSTAVGYSAGSTKNPNYEQVCSGLTGHNEVVRVRFDPKKVPLTNLFKLFWENHDPTQGMRQGNDIGTQYRSGIYCSKKTQLEVAQKLREKYQRALKQVRFGTITTEIKMAETFYLAEDYHQQYLAKNTSGYCGVGGTGVQLG